MLKNYPDTKFKKEVGDLLHSYLGENYSFFIFGSRVVGGGSDRSDIDIGISGMSPVPDSKMLMIREKLDDFPLLYKIDVVDFSKVSDEFKSVALQKIIPLN